MTCPFKRTPDRSIRNALVDWDEVDREVAALILEAARWFQPLRPLSTSDEQEPIRDSHGWHCE